MNLVQQTQALNERLTRLEEQWEDRRHDTVAHADSEDLLELRVQSARLAAELSRVTVELRSEIDDLARATGVGQPARPTANDDDDDGPRSADTIDAAIEGVIDLSSRRDRAQRPAGWRPIDPASRS